MGVHSIGEAARRTGLSADTLRYYERIGLVGPIARDAGGRRVYGEGDLARVRFVRRAQAMGFSLAEAAALLEVRDRGRRARRAARELAGRKLAEVEARIEELRSLRDELASLVAACERGTGERCPIIAGMEGEGTVEPGGVERRR